MADGRCEALHSGSASAASGAGEADLCEEPLDDVGDADRVSTRRRLRVDSLVELPPVRMPDLASSETRCLRMSSAAKPVSVSLVVPRTSSSAPSSVSKERSRRASLAESAGRRPRRWGSKTHGRPSRTQRAQPLPGAGPVHFT
jgi:hypothetical protein